jgi:hypothetical protein
VRVDPSKIKIGDTIDLMDKQGVWCKALIELKIITANRPPLFYIHYLGWHRKYDEYIYGNSSRFAPLGVYTTREDIPRYCVDPNNTNLVHTAAMVNNREEELRYFSQL